MKMMILCALLLLGLSVHGQQKTRRTLKVVFYNTENFFDWINDPLVNDEEFLPGGSRKWTRYRFEDKAVNLFKVLAGIGQSEFPDIIGLAEVENAFVLNYLTKQTPMKKIPVSYIHRDSEDPRGIDACILYRTDKLKLLRQDFIKIRQRNGHTEKTRDIVYASFMTREKEVLHVFVNHWPSRSGGELKTQQKRFLVASILRQKADSLLQSDPSARMIILGDFNDEPYNSSILKILQARPPEGKISPAELYNLSAHFIKSYGTGTLKYRGSWSVYDQVIVSGSLLGKDGLNTCLSCAGVYNNTSLLTTDKTHMGLMPWRTYSGLRYSGGFSDHLPVYLNLFF
jgi:endonuclease/exonuclease/phosphatase family metal-dependent hydrolase